MPLSDDLVAKMDAIWGPPTVAAISEQMEKLPLTATNLVALIDAVHKFAHQCLLYGDTSEAINYLSDARGAAKRSTVWSDS